MNAAVSVARARQTHLTGCRSYIERRIEMEAIQSAVETAPPGGCRRWWG